MKKYIGLKHEKEFVPVIDGARRYYGGDQAWFATKLRRYSACGTVAAANILAYTELYKGHRYGLGGSRAAGAEEVNCYTLDQYITFMNAIYKYVKPLRIPPFISENTPSFMGFGWSAGVWPAGRLAGGVRRFAGQRGQKLRPIFYGNLRENPYRFIGKALRMDCPVALLIGDTKILRDIRVDLPDAGMFIQPDFSRHWVTITAAKRDKGKILVKVSTWGGSAWLPLGACFKTTFIKSRMCCFVPVV